MQVSIVNDRWIKVVRDENDKPRITPQTSQTPQTNKKPSPKEYNSQRKDYILAFNSTEEARAALAKVQSFPDFDSACVWLDKQ